MAASGPGWFAKRDVSNVTYPSIRPLIKWTYTWMILGLLVTAVVANYTVNSGALVDILENNVGMIYGALIFEVLLVLALGFLLPRLSPTVAAVLFIVYAAVNGFTLSIYGFIYTGESIAVAFVTTAAVFGIMSIFAFTTSIDLLQYRSYFMIGLIGLLVALVINIFVRSGPFETLISLFGVVLFTALTAYDTQKLKYMAASPQFAEDGVAVAKYSIFGALQLYLDFINLFIFLLRLTGRRR